MKEKLERLPSREDTLGQRAIKEKSPTKAGEGNLKP